MKMIYYPVPPAGSTSTSLPLPAGGAWSKGTPPPKHLVPMTPAKLALAVLKDIDPAGKIPLLRSGGLWSIFSSMYQWRLVGTSRVLVAQPNFASIPGNWLRMFSELVGAATSLAVAEQQELYPYCLSMQFCKKGAGPPHGLGTSAWPLAYTAAVQTSWFVEKLPSIGGQPSAAEMPDYVIARQVKGGQFEFATLESKARNLPIDSGTYTNYKKFKRQAQNAVIVGNPGAPSPPILTRKILSLVAVRPQLKRTESRALRCRWANSRVDDDVETPRASDRAGLRFALASISITTSTPRPPVRRSTSSR